MSSTWTPILAAGNSCRRTNPATPAAAPIPIIFFRPGDMAATIGDGVPALKGARAPFERDADCQGAVLWHSAGATVRKHLSPVAVIAALGMGPVAPAAAAVAFAGRSVPPARAAASPALPHLS